MTKVNQIRVSRNVKFFAERMMNKFALLPYTKQDEPLVLYGVYNDDDYQVYQEHNAPLIVLWRGTDAKILNERKAKIILSRNSCKHYAGSETVKKSLAAWGIKSEIKAITSTPMDLKPVPRGDAVYCYICSSNPLMSSKYKYDQLLKLKERLPYKFFFTEQKSYRYEDLKNVYARCFVGVRLLDHDGMSNTVLEMGLMGRRTICNSSLPFTIGWKTIKDVQASIIEEYKRRRKPDYEIIGRKYRELIDIGESWLLI